MRSDTNILQAVRFRGLPFDPRLEEPNETSYAAMETATSGDDVYPKFCSKLSYTQ